MRLPLSWLQRRGYQLEGERMRKTGPEVDPDVAEILTERPQLALRWVPPELALSCALAEELDARSLSGQLAAVWSATEAGARAGGHRGARAQTRLRAAGVQAGWPDFTFLWRTGSGVLELKSATGKLSQAQQAVRRWCLRQGVHHAVVRSVPEALDSLRAWGVLT